MQNSSDTGIGEAVEERTRHSGQSHSQCVVCGSTDSVTNHSFSHQATSETRILLCRKCQQLFKILGKSGSPGPAKQIADACQRTTKVTVRVPEVLVDSADTTAEQDGQTRSELVRDALQTYIELQEVGDAANDLLLQAVQPGESSQISAEEEVAFLKERIRTLESLLERSMDKI